MGPVSPSLDLDNYPYIKNQDPSIVVDNVMLYRNFFLGFFSIVGKWVWWGVGLSMSSKSAILGWGKSPILESRPIVYFFKK